MMFPHNELECPSCSSNDVCLIGDVNTYMCLSCAYRYYGSKEET